VITAFSMACHLLTVHKFCRND